MKTTPLLMWMGLLVLPAWAQDSMENPSKDEQDKDRTEKTEKDIEKGKRRLSDSRYARLAEFALEKRKEGLDPKDLEKDIRKKEHELWDEQVKAREKGEKEEEADTEEKDEAKEGLNKKDRSNLGKFVNDKLAEGLKGKDLAEAIHKEHDRIKEARDKDREKEKEKGEKERDREKDREKDKDKDRDRDRDHDRGRDKDK